jgi:hypothetical protein
MGLGIDKSKAETTFARALEIARADARLPREWIERVEKVGMARNITFLPMLGTALLARATDRHIDPLSLRDDESHKSYSARDLAKTVLVPCCMAAGINIRTTGAEPLNNQPFLRAPRITLDLKVHKNARADFEFLYECLTKVDFLENESAVAALAAFLRVRIAVTAAHLPVSVADGTLTLADLERALDAFVAGDAEGGKVGQAVVAGMLDVVFPDVRTKRINDPSVKWPGDVGVFAVSKLSISTEVKQRPFTEAEVLLFAARLREKRVSRAWIAALAQQGKPLPESKLRTLAYEQSGVALAVFTKASELLRAAVMWSAADLETCLREFPRKLLARLDELHVSTLRRAEWAALFEKGTQPTGSRAGPRGQGRLL